MDKKDLSQEEIELINNFRKQKLQCNIIKETERNQFSYTNKIMKFLIEEDKVKISTRECTNECKTDQFRSACGFFNISLDVEDCKQIRDFLNTFIGC